VCSFCGHAVHGPGGCDNCAPHGGCNRLPSYAAALGRKGGAAGRGQSKHRDVDYAALGRKGGKAGKGKRKPRE
jgi:general stress protein YciG